MLHPDERRLGSTRGVYAGCSCCCCCCVHALGGLIGAAIGSRPSKADPTSTKQAFETNRGDVEPIRPRSAAGVYWYVLLAVCAVSTIALAVMISHGDPGDWQDALLAGGVITLLVLPGLQLVASVVTVLGFVAFRVPDPPWASLARITWQGFLGSAVGLLAMLALFIGIQSINL
jgi:hypothetical protein